MTKRMSIITLAASVAALVLASPYPARAAPKTSAVKRQNFVKKLQTPAGAIVFTPPETINPAEVNAILRQVNKYGRRIPPIPAVVRNATPLQVNNRQRLLLEHYRRVAATRPNNAAFGGVYPGGATLYIPVNAVNIVTYFPVFRL